MGYTHYWYRPLKLKAAPFNALVEDVKLLLKHLPNHSHSAGDYHGTDPLVIRGWDGTGIPEVTTDLISFNGYALTEHDHETCYLPRVLEPEKWQYPDPEEGGKYFQFCKTSRKPYDLVVCAVLMALKHHFPEVKVASDGNPEEWHVPVAWYIDILLRQPPSVGPWVPGKEEE